MMLRSYSTRIIIRQHHIYYAEGWYDYDINLRMPEESKQMIKEYNITAVSVIKEGCIPVTV